MYRKETTFYKSPTDTKLTFVHYIHLYSPHNVVAQLLKQTKTKSKNTTNEKERIAQMKYEVDYQLTMTSCSTP